MYNEQIHKAMWKYLEDAFKYTLLEELPLEFRTPHCITCAYWFPINEDGLDHLAQTLSPREYDEIIRDLKGQRFSTYRVKGEIEDVYPFRISDLAFAVTH